MPYCNFCGSQIDHVNYEQEYSECGTAYGTAQICFNEDDEDEGVDFEAYEEDDSEAGDRDYDSTTHTCPRCYHEISQEDIVMTPPLTHTVTATPITPPWSHDNYRDMAIDQLNNGRNGQNSHAVSTDLRIRDNDRIDTSDINRNVTDLIDRNRQNDVPFRVVECPECHKPNQYGVSTNGILCAFCNADIEISQ